MSNKPKHPVEPESSGGAPTELGTSASTPAAADAPPTDTGEAPAPAAGKFSSWEERVSELERDLAAARADVAAASDRALRSLAEFDNYRRRTDRERDEATTRGRADVLRELLEVADNFDRALDHGKSGVPPAFFEGMKLVARGLHDLLDRKGVERIDAEGKPFDPELHEALTMMPSDDAEPHTVLQVVQAGYRLGDRVLRPAKVIVAAPPQHATKPAEDA